VEFSPCFTGMRSVGSTGHGWSRAVLLLRHRLMTEYGVRAPVFPLLCVVALLVPDLSAARVTSGRDRRASLRRGGEAEVSFSPNAMSIDEARMNGTALRVVRAPDSIAVQLSRPVLRGQIAARTIPVTRRPFRCGVDVATHVFRALSLSQAPARHHLLEGRSLHGSTATRARRRGVLACVAALHPIPRRGASRAATFSVPSSRPAGATCRRSSRSGSTGFPAGDRASSHSLNDGRDQRGPARIRRAAQNLPGPYE
jgi:hypothetical protein